jgi:hypothetical protein
MLTYPGPQCIHQDSDKFNEVKPVLLFCPQVPQNDHMIVQEYCDKPFLIGKFRYEGDAKWIVIRGQLGGHIKGHRGQLRGHMTHNDMPFRRPTWAYLVRIWAYLVSFHYY